MKKIKFLFIALIISIFFGYVLNYVNAEENKDVSSEQNEQEDISQILNLIDEYLTQINDKINEIDAKIKKSQEQKEFEYYPAIRLNIDTPFFGMSSVIDYKLVVKKDISTADVASGYSIRDIASKRTIRLPDTYLGSIVTSTKEYIIDDTLTPQQAKIVLVKCIQYLSQVDSVNDYVDTQINYIFKNYISDEKKSNIKDVKDRAKKVTSKLENIAQTIKKLQLMGVDTSEYNSEYLNLRQQVNEIKATVKDSLISEDELAQIQKSSLSNESEIITFESTINSSYQDALENLDYVTLYTNLYNEYKSKEEKMKAYIDGSTTKITQDSQENTIKNYAVTSESTLEYLEENLSSIKAQLDQESSKEKSQQENDNSSQEQVVAEMVKTEEQLAQEKSQKVEENKSKINDIYTTYSNIINKEYKFYIDNLNMLLRDSNNKLSQIYSYLNTNVDVDNDIFDYTRYIYIELPENLENYIEENNINSPIELNILVNELSKEINTLSLNNKNITSTYEDINNKLS